MPSSLPAKTHFTNNAAEAAEGAQKAESSLTWTLVNMPVSTVAHWIKISKQLAADAPALAAYVDTRMRYGVNQKVDIQLVVGDGTAPNISGTYDKATTPPTAMPTPRARLHAEKLVLIRKIMVDLYAAGYPADAIVLNPADWATIEIELFCHRRKPDLVLGQRSRSGATVRHPGDSGSGHGCRYLRVGRFSEAYMIYKPRRRRGGNERFGWRQLPEELDHLAR